MADEPRLRVATSVPRDFLEFIGAVSVNFGALENALAVSIWSLLDDDSGVPHERYQVVTAQLSFKQLVWMFANLYRERFEGANEDTIAGFVKACSQAGDRRNVSRTLSGLAALRRRVRPLRRDSSSPPATTA